MLKVTATVEHGNETYIDHRNKVSAADLDRVEAEIRREAPLGSSIGWDIRTW